MIWAIDKRGEATYVGGEWEAFAAPNETHSLHIRILSNVHPDDRAEVEEVFDSARQKRLPLTCVFRMRHRDGSWRRMSARGVPTIDPSSGRLVGFLGTTYEMMPGDLTTSTVGWAVIREATSHRPRAALDAIADHLLIARAYAEENGETRLAAVIQAALEQIFEPLGIDAKVRQ